MLGYTYNVYNDRNVVAETLQLTTTNNTVINDISTDPTLSGNSNTILSTEQAIKTYVDNSIGAENLFDRSGNNLVPHYSGDGIKLNGTGGLISGELSGYDSSLTTPNIGIGNKSVLAGRGIKIQHNGTPYSSVDIYSDGSPSIGYNCTYTNAGIVTHSNQGNCYLNQCSSGNSGIFNLAGSYALSQGQSFVGSSIFQCQMIGANESKVKIPCTKTYPIIVADPQPYILADVNGYLGYESSLKKYKEIVADIDYSNIIYNSNVISFKYKKQFIDPITNEISYILNPESSIRPGLIAEEVEKLDDRFCFYIDRKNFNLPENQPPNEIKEWELQGINYCLLICPLIKCVQDQKKELDVAKSDINNLKISVFNLQSANADLLTRIIALENK